MKKEKKLNNKGFSLVELIIVIAIMAVLAGALAPQLIKYIDKSKKSTDVQTGQTIATAVNSALANPDAYDDAATSTLTAIYSEATPDDFETEIKEILGATAPVPKYKTGTYSNFYIVVDGTDKSFKIYAIGASAPGTLDDKDLLYPTVGANFK